MPRTNPPLKACEPTYACLAGSVEQLGGGGYDGAAAVAAQRTGDEVVEHVNNQDCGFV